MNYFSFSGLLITLTSLSFGALVFLKGKINKDNRIWVIFCLAVAIWGLGAYEIGITKNEVMAFFWWRFTHVGVIFIPVLFLHYVCIFLQIERKKIIFSVYLIGIFFLIVDLFTKSFISNMRWTFNSFFYDSPPGIFYYFFIIFFFGFIFYTHIELYKAFKQAPNIKKAQIKYFFIATALGFSGGITSFLPVFKIDIYPILNFTVPLYPIIMTYAIVRHRLMDIKLVLRKYFVYTLSLISIVLPAFLLKLIIDPLFASATRLSDLLILILAVLFFSPVRNYYYRLANKYFFSSLYDSKEVIAEVSDNLSSTLEANKIYDFISNILMNAFHVKTIGILVFDEKKEDYILVHNRGLNTGKQKRFKSDTKLQQAYADRSDPIIVEELRDSFYEEYKETIDLFTTLGIEMLVPLDIKKRPIGLIVLGAKESGDMYNNEDLQVLKVVGAQTAVALENALLYKGTKEFNVKLKKEVNIATTELRTANDQLKQLDEAKSEFISIASHQLRTPLTAIKGYISMMLEGDFGALTAPEHSSLEKVFESNERLIRLVEDLLNISRIESGRLQFNFADGSLDTMVEGVVDELSGNAKKKALKLIYNKPDKPVVKIKMDEDKLRQVIMNLVDNSIKYTKQGNVTVSLKQTEENLEFCVADSGMGISKEDLPNLFQKFSRGTGTSLIHTEGTGLGLYVARMMIEAHHGTIWAESEGEDKGSRFCFKIPIGQ